MDEKNVPVGIAILKVGDYIRIFSANDGDETHLKEEKSILIPFDIFKTLTHFKELPDSIPDGKIIFMIPSDVPAEGEVLGSFENIGKKIENERFEKNKDSPWFG